MATPKHMHPDFRSTSDSVVFPAGRLAVMAIIGICSALLSLLLVFVLGNTCFSLTTGGWFNRFWFVYFAVVLFVVGTLIAYREWLENKPENLYLVIVLCMGLMFAWSNSVRTVGWDTGVHYRNALAFSGLQGDVEMSESDVMFVEHGPDVIGRDDSLQAINNHENDLDSHDFGVADTIRGPRDFRWFLTNIEYAPYALVNVVCTVLGVSFARKIVLMRACGVVFYSFVSYLGMRKLRERKMLYACIALLPTSVFLAAELGYSYWLFSLCLYGFGMLLGMRQGSVPVNALTLIKMLGALLLGILPRVVYFPLMFMCLLIPTERFSSVRTARVYRTVLVGSALVTFAIWLVPRLMSGFGTGDSRGGSNISPSAQISYILSHPVEYARTFVRFVFPPLVMEGGGPDVEGTNLIGGFLSPAASPGLLANYGYLPRTHWVYTAIIWILLLTTTLTDKWREHRQGALPGVLALVLTSGIFVMIVTALYFDFTPVGLGEIHGVQRRYLIPLLFPLLAFVGPSVLGVCGAEERIRSATYRAVLLCSMTVVVASSWWTSNLAYVL